MIPTTSSRSPFPRPKALGLLAHRLHYYAQHNLLLYCVDLCYYVHACGLHALWWGEISSPSADPSLPPVPNEWALANLASAVGPVGGAVFMLQSPLLLHHPEVSYSQRVPAACECATWIDGPRCFILGSTWIAPLVHASISPSVLPILPRTSPARVRPFCPYSIAARSLPSPAHPRNPP